MLDLRAGRNTDMTRRAFIKIVSAILGFLSLPGRALAKGISDEVILEGILDAIIPSGNTPGARDAGLHKKILSMLKKDKVKREIYRQGIQSVRNSIKTNSAKIDWVKVVQGIERTEFFHTIRRDAMRGFYSDPVSWEAIGYDGPPLSGYGDYYKCRKNSDA